MDMIPVNEPILDGNEKKYLIDCIESGWISSEGPYVRLLEEKFAKKIDRKFGIAVSNGSAALDVAAASLELGKGDEVIMPTFTIISCAAAIIRTGAKPVVIDCDPLTWNMDVNMIERRITPRTKAIMVVHIYGLPVDMDPVLELAKKYRLAVIEDAAEAIGQAYKGTMCGGFGQISTFSFYPNKLVTTGEGGMIFTDDKRIAEKCRYYRNLCFTKDRRFIHQHLGWNYRISNVQAAIGLAQLERLDEFILKKKRIGRRYTELLSDIAVLQLPLLRTDYADNLFWIYGLVLKDDVIFDAEVAMQKLRSYKIGSRPFFWPLHEQPVFRKKNLFKGQSYPVAEKIARRGFYIPCGLSLTDIQMDRVSYVLHEVIK